jgi:Fibronectin type III domain
MANQDGFPWPQQPPQPPSPQQQPSPPPWAAGPPPSEPKRSGRKRTIWIVAVSAVVAVGLVVGLLVWAPWHKVPVAPTAVNLQSPTATSVLVSWTASKGGATIDHYLVLRDGRQVGSVPASQTSYTDNGLSPGTNHRYTVVAASGTQRSSPSKANSVTTIAPSPVGLAAGQATWTTVAFHWTPSPKAPAPSEYVIYSAGTSIAVVPGTITSYNVTGLKPGTANQYQVVAKWGNQASSPTATLDAPTLLPPLQGSVPVHVTTTSTPGSGASLHVGEKWDDSWTFSSNCTSSKCTLTTNAEFAAPGFASQPFTMILTGSGSGYAGSAHADVTKCGSINVHNTVTLHITPDKGAVTNGGWNSWSGTMVLSSPYVMASSTTFCPVQSWNFGVTGTHG